MQRVLQLLARTEAGARPVRLLGVSVSALLPDTPGGGRQLEFPDLESDTRRDP